MSNHLNQMPMNTAEQPTITSNIEVLALEASIEELEGHSVAAGAECFPVPEKNETSAHFQSTWPTVTV